MIDPQITRVLDRLLAGLVAAIILGGLWIVGRAIAYFSN
jgi:hypothetical protein